MTGVVGLLAAALVGVSSGSAHADVVSTEAVTAGDSVAGDAVSAAGLAWRSRRPVEVLSERTESSETFVLPDGTWRTRQHASPVRVRRGSEWVAVDPTLAVAGGAVVPRAAVLDMRFSNGGSGPLVTIMRGDRSLAISWPDALRVRVPVLDGDTATYAEVLPGVDLRLSAGVDSFAEVLVVKSAEAAKSSELERLRFGLAAQGLSVRQDSTGFLTVAGAAGEVVFASDGARMWDEPQALPARAVAGARSLRAGVTSAGAEVLPQAPESLHVEDVPVHLDGSSLTVVPSKAMLSAADTKFPVYIDPVFNGGSEIWTHVSRKNPSKSYWTDAATRDDMRVGQLWHGSADDDWRTLVQFDITTLKKSDIRSAAVLVNVQHSANCAPSPLQLWQTDPISRSAAVTWNSTKGKWWKALGEVQATANKSACPKGNDEVKFAQNAVKAAFQAATDPKKPSTITFAFRAKSESDDFQWKKLKPGSAYLEVVYNHKPGKPVLSPISPCFASCAGGTAVTSSKRPSLGMKVADPDGGTLRYEYEVYKSDQKTRVAASGNTKTGMASNSVRWWQPAGDLPDGSYFWRGRGCDGYGCGDYSGWFGFAVDTANPNKPSVSSVLYQPTGWNGGPTVPGRFRFTPGGTSDGVKTYFYSLNGAKEIPVAPVDASGVERDIVPGRDFENVLAVRAVDAAGNSSGTFEYRFWVKPVGETWRWSFDGLSGTVAGSAPNNDRPATMSGTGVTWSVPGKDGDGAVSFAGGGELTTSRPVVDTSNAYTVAAWVRLPEPPADPASSAAGTDPSAGDDPEKEQTPPNDEQAPPRPGLPTRNLVAVSQDGRNTSVFRLGYRMDLDVTGDGKADPAWCFTVADADVAGSATANACTTQFVEAGAWVHLVGIVNPTADKPVQLYVNGTPLKRGVLADVAAGARWAATGVVAIGRGWNGAESDRWVGQVDEVYVTPRVWEPREIDQKAHASEVDLP